VNEQTVAQLTALSDHLAMRRTAILAEWRKAADLDPAQTTVSSLTRAQFNDHIPQLLDAFERKLRAQPGGRQAAVADAVKTREDVKHGLQRWQQGYRLTELMHEWGHLHVCLFAEVEAFAKARPDVSGETMFIVCRELIGLVNEGINESAGQYARMEQAEAAGHVRDLQRAVADVNDLEHRRSGLIHQAVHDLRTNVQSVSISAEILQAAGIAEDERQEFAKLVQQGVESVNAMLGELMTLARLEAGQERREIAPFDVAKAIGELCATTQPVAAKKNLFLRIDGPTTLLVEGDAAKLRRLVQNLLFNAIKYTQHGGVTVSWGEERESWWVTVSDTGPGILKGPGAPIVSGLNEATASAREAAESAAETSGEANTVLPRPPDTPAAVHRSSIQQTGEGIGLSIVKRLCELLDASLELASSAETGTTFRIVFPRRYPQPAGA
jgi:signal transduction histidine kinase